MPALQSGILWRASLPMYNLPEMRQANAAFWDAIGSELQRQRDVALPAALDFERRPVPDEIERDTLLTQVCGYPLQTIYRGQAVVLGAPVYAAEHCQGPTRCGRIRRPSRVRFQAGDRS